MLCKLVSILIAYMIWKYETREETEIDAPRLQKQQK
jgi:hypothetical protein